MTAAPIYEWAWIREGRTTLTTRSPKTVHSWTILAQKRGGTIERYQVGYRIPWSVFAGPDNQEERAK